MTTSDPQPAALRAATLEWLAAFEQALAQGNAASLFLPDGHWRDVLAFDWEISTHSGTQAIAAMLAAHASRVAPHGLHLPADRTAPRWVKRAGQQVAEVIFGFTTSIGPCHAVARLVPTPQGLRAFTLVTLLAGLHGHEDRSTLRYASGADYSRDFGGENWLDKRNKARAYAEHDPAVIVVGGGQAGLSIAARLGAMGVDTLIVDRQARIGDNWRQRYHALTLHNEVHVNHLPYMPFPPTWPVFIPKDKLANWFESYVDALDLNFWPSTELTGGSYNEAAGHWDVELKRADGSTRHMRPRHVVFATGVSSIPIMPKLPGLADFAGTVLHSGAYTEGSAWKGKRTLVLGTGNSGHDVVQDLHYSGAHVGMIQRSPTYVVSIQEAQAVYSIYNEGIPIADCDLLATAMPYPVLRQAYQLSTAASAERDKPLHDALSARGF